MFVYFGDIKETAIRKKCCFVKWCYTVCIYHHDRNGLNKRLGRQPTI